MRFKIIIFFTVILILPLRAQILLTHHYTMEDGLVSDNVNSICQDSLGYIWFGTGEGLSKFDSKDFVNYGKEDGLPSVNISCVAADRKNGRDIWIGTYGHGIIKYSDGRFISIGQNLSDDEKNITSLFVDNNNVLWCGTDSSIFYVKNDSVFVPGNPLGISEVNSVTDGGGGKILISTSSGAFIYDSKTGVYNKISARISGNIVSAGKTSDNSFLILNSNGIFYRLHGDNIQKVALGKIGVFSHIFPSGNPDLYWISSDHGAYEVRLNNLDRPVKYTVENGLAGNNINCMLADREGVLWFGTNGKGVIKVPMTNLLKFKIPESVKNVYNVETAVDINGHVWIITSDRLIEFWRDGKSGWHSYTQLKLSLDAKGALAKVSIAQGTKLFVTYDRGVIKEFNIFNKHPLSENPSVITLSSSTVLSGKYKFYGLFFSREDSAGYLWTSALDLGMAVLSKTIPHRVLKIFTTKDGLPDNSIRCMYQDKKGNYWFGGYDGGLGFISLDKVHKELGLKYAKAKVKARLYTTKDGLANNSVRSITEDDTGALLIGTRYGGLSILKNGLFKTTNRSDGLVSNGIWHVTFTKNYGTWLATQGGVQKIAENGSVENDLKGEIPNIPFYSICLNKNYIVFSNPTEIFVYSPSATKPGNKFPPVFIKNVLVNGRKFNLKSGTKLANIQNNITFEFIGITNVVESRMYDYRLLNTQQAWARLVNRNSVTYASLQPGTYTFEVASVNRLGERSLNPAELTFTIKSPFYRQPWFLAGIFILIVSSVILFLRYRLKRLLEIERVRTKIAEELHDEIGAGLTKIAILSEHALINKSDKDPATNLNTKGPLQNQSIVRVGNIARSLIDQMVDVIWSIDPKYDRLEDYLIHFKGHAYEVCGAQNIKLSISSENVKDVKLGLQAKRKLQLISSEALNNSLKHSGCTEIKYSLSVKGKFINLNFSDNGKGIPDKLNGNGNGLANMRKHVTELNGTIEISRGEKSGTEISIRLPINK